MALLGVAILCATCLYEEQEGKAQQWLVELWVRLDDWRKQHVLIQQFVEACARQSQVVLEGIFGSAIVSLRALSISFSFAVASYIFTMRMTHSPGSHDAGWAVITIVSACLASTYPNRLMVLIALLVPTCYIGALVSRLHALPISRTSFELSSVSFALALLLACVFDFVWIAAHRKFIAIAVEKHWSTSIAIGLLISGIVCATPLLLPVLDQFPSSVYHSNLLYNLFLFASVLLSTRLLMAAAAAAFFLTMTSAAVYKPLHSVIAHGVYFLQRHEVIRNRRLLAILGVSLVLAALGRDQWHSLLNGLI